MNLPGICSYHSFHFIYLFINPHQDGTIKTAKKGKTAEWNKWLTQGSATPDLLSEIHMLSFSHLSLSLTCEYEFIDFSVYQVGHSLWHHDTKIGSTPTPVTVG